MDHPKARVVSLLGCALCLVSTTLTAQDRGFVRDVVAGHWEGRVAMRVDENLAAGTSRTVVSLRTAQGALEIAPDSVNPAWKPNQRISIDGRLSGARIAVDRWSTPSEQSGQDAPAAVSGTCSTTGPQKLAVLMLSFPSTPFPSYVTASYVQNTLFGPDPSTAGLIADASYGQTSVTGQVLGPINMPTDFPTGDFEDIANAAILAADQTHRSSGIQPDCYDGPHHDRGGGPGGFYRLPESEFAQLRSLQRILDIYARRGSQ